MVKILPANRVLSIGGEIVINEGATYDKLREQVHENEVLVVRAQNTSAFTHEAFVIQEVVDFHDVLRMSLCGNIVITGYYSFPKNDEALYGLPIN